MDVLRMLALRFTPQNQHANPRQVPNSAGGYAFQLDDAARLRRFLILGVAGGSYYATDRGLALDNVQVLQRMAAAEPEMLVKTIVDVSVRGVAPKQNPALFALAYAASVPESAALALAALPKVARTGTQLFQFAGYVRQCRGWGRGLRRAVARWYTSRDAGTLAYQAVKYRQREGWSHRDLLRLAHPVSTVPETRAVFDWIVRQTTGEATPKLIHGFLAAQSATDATAWAGLVREYRLGWEMLPDAALGSPAVWEALLDIGLPQTALLRQLSRLTQLGLLDDLGGRTAEVCAQLADPERLRRARVHPINVLIAGQTYAAGRGARGRGTWQPCRAVVDALDAGFYAAYGAVTPAGKRTLIGLDVSGSMGHPVSGIPLTARAAATALSLVQVATEPAVKVVGFTGGSEGVRPLAISPRQRLSDALRVTDGLPFGRTDCALPMRYALRHRMPVETFVVYTDNETWCGEIHPHQALIEYRRKMGIPARLIVVAMTATGFSIADPEDAGMLDVVGFDTAVPNLISEFSRGFEE